MTCTPTWGMRQTVVSDGVGEAPPALRCSSEAALELNAGISGSDAPLSVVAPLPPPSGDASCCSLEARASSAACIKLAGFMAWGVVERTNECPGSPQRSLCCCDGGGGQRRATLRATLPRPRHCRLRRSLEWKRSQPARPASRSTFRLRSLYSSDAAATLKEGTVDGARWRARPEARGPPPPGRGMNRRHVRGRRRRGAA